MLLYQLNDNRPLSRHIYIVHTELNLQSDKHQNPKLVFQSHYLILYILSLPNPLFTYELFANLINFIYISNFFIIVQLLLSQFSTSPLALFTLPPRKEIASLISAFGQICAISFTLFPNPLPSCVQKGIIVLFEKS